MNSFDVALRVSKLRRELEEILAIVNADPKNVVRAPAGVCLTSPPDQTGARQKTVNRELSGIDQIHDDLYDNALVVVTEFGQATSSILQMWLSIDYGRAARILTQFEAEGLVSPKGKPRHKAYVQRRSISEL